MTSVMEPKRKKEKSKKEKRKKEKSKKEKRKKEKRKKEKRKKEKRSKDERRKKRSGTSCAERKKFKIAVKHISSQIVKRQNENVHKTPLVFAIMFEKFELAKDLISWGVDDVRAKNDLGQTALQYAVTHPMIIPIDADTSMTRCKCNVSIYKRSKHDCMISRIIAFNTRCPTIASLVATRRKGQAFDRAARLSLVKMLLKAGSEVNNKDFCGCSPIHCAVYTGDLELLSILIDAGADIDTRNDVGATPLHDAVLCGDVEVVRLLLERGARSNVKTAKGHTPLHWAALLDRKHSPASAIIKVLLRYSVDVNSRNDKGRTVFHYIMCNFADDSDILERFLELRADINAKDIIGATPFSLNGLNLLHKKLPVLPVNVEERRIILEQVAAIEARTGKPVFDEYNLTVIDGNSETKSFYERCRAELEAMRRRNIKDTSFTYFHILTEPVWVLLRHARNEELHKLVLEEFHNSDYQTVYPIYGPRLKAKLDATNIG